MIKDTSLSSLIDLISSGGKLTQEEKVVGVFLNHTGPVFTRQELAHYSGLGINAICGRVNSLVAAGYLSSTGNKLCSITGRFVEGLFLTSKLK